MATTVTTLELGRIELPDWHPHAADRTCLIQGYVIEHPDGVVVFDTGASDDHEWLNETYRPRITPIVEALNGIGVDERDVGAIVNSHLHFDHCGQNRSLPWAPVWAQSAEYTMVDAKRYTIAEWATVAPDRLRLIEGDEQLAEGVRIISTPGHTPGHQSVLVQSGGATTVLGGQCCYTCAEFESGEAVPDDVYDGSWATAAGDSIDRLKSFTPDVVHLSHDRTVLRKPS